jgi:hypothetical protein
VGLVIVADQTIAHLENVEALVAIYLKVSNKADRLAIWPLITEANGEYEQTVGAADTN